MTLVASTMLELGTNAPDFELPDVITGRSVTTATAAGRNGLRPVPRLSWIQEPRKCVLLQPGDLI